jgi:hypothetical protein
VHRLYGLAFAAVSDELELLFGEVLKLPFCRRFNGELQLHLVVQRIGQGLELPHEFAVNDALVLALFGLEVGDLARDHADELFLQRPHVRLQRARHDLRRRARGGGRRFEHHAKARGAHFESRQLRSDRRRVGPDLTTTRHGAEGFKHLCFERRLGCDGQKRLAAVVHVRDNFHGTTAS